MDFISNLIYIYIMCLYPRLIKNKKYLPNKKNNFNPPTCEDERLLYVAVGCGNCIECRKQKAREWQVRLTEEIKQWLYKYFVTLTFSEESINNIADKIKSEDANIIARYAVRHFLERYRKKYKHSIHHWLITELGHTKTERIHLHGLLFTNENLSLEELQELWQYGIADNGKYVNNRTINYIVKYVTKIDNDHKGYKPQIFSSAGIGRVYTTTRDFAQRKYEGENTIEYYTLPNGYKCNLPTYYRNKLYTEEEREKLWLNKLNAQETYVMGMHIKLRTDKDIEHYQNVLKEQQDLNIKLGYGGNGKEWQKKQYKARVKHLNAISRLQKIRKIPKKCYFSYHKLGKFKNISYLCTIINNLKSAAHLQTAQDYENYIF